MRPEGHPGTGIGPGADAGAAVNDGGHPDQTDFPGQIEVKGIALVSNATASPPTASQHASAIASASDPAGLGEAQPAPPHSPVVPSSQPGVWSGGPFGCSPLHVQLAVTGSLHKLLLSKLQAIAGGSAEEDERQASDPQCTPAARMALQYRADQKRIAAAALTSLAHVVTAIVCRASETLLHIPNGLQAMSQEPAKVLHDMSQVCLILFHVQYQFE